MQNLNTDSIQKIALQYSENQKQIDIPRFIDIADSYQDNYHKVVFQNITSPEIMEFEINQGLVLKESMISQFKDFLKTDLKFDSKKDSQSSLIYPIKFQNIPLVIGVNLDRNGIFERVQGCYLLEQGYQYYFGFPAGENLQLIDVQLDVITINNQSYNIEEGLSILLVKSFQQKIKQYQQQVMEGGSKCSSRIHAQIICQNNKLFIFDGFDNHKSQNGVWLSIVHQKLNLNSIYCFRDFRLLLQIKY